MPTSPELKILDLIIKAADEASRFNPLSSGAAFALFSNKLLDIQSKMKDACSCDECSVEKSEVVIKDVDVKNNQRVWYELAVAGKARFYKDVHDEYRMGWLTMPDALEVFAKCLDQAQAKGAEKERTRILELLKREEIEEVASYERKLEGRPSRQLQEQVKIELPVVKSIYAIIKKAITLPTS